MDKRDRTERWKYEILSDHTNEAREGDINDGFRN